MAKNESGTGLYSVLARMGIGGAKWRKQNVPSIEKISASDAYIFEGGTTAATLLGSGRRSARTRAQIYEKWQYMEGDPIISSALQIIVSSALGGHETSGDLVFIEKSVKAESDAQQGKIVDEMKDSLTELFNRNAHNVAYNGIAFGDGYARTYLNSSGLRDLYTGEMVRASLVQPFEQGSRTVGYVVYVGEKIMDRLDVSQLVRMRMPRTIYVPQLSIVEKAFRTAIQEDDPDNLPYLPADVGGSFLYQAEEAYDHLYSSLLGLVGQRWIDSIDEQMLGVNLEGMTAQQQKSFLTSVTNTLLQSKERAASAVKMGRPILERIRHILPLYGEKQLIKIDPNSGSGRVANLGVEDVMFHARMLAGALGTDLSMLGFADQLSGGLGDGGFFRVSAQIAERARVIRVAQADFYNRLCDLHTLNRYGIVFAPAERPWRVNFYGSIAAAEAEKQRTRLDGMNGGMMLTQTLQQLKELGATAEVAAVFLSKQMQVDEDQAKMYATLMSAADPRAEGEGGRGDF